MESKESMVLEILFNNPRQWHFEELKRKVKIGRPQLARWLKVFEKQGIISRVKERGKMPYYIQNFSSAAYRNRKKLFAYQKLLDSGLLDHLASLSKAKAVILFGSFSRADWYWDSDIDLFILGEDSDFEQGKYELRLKRDIQVHSARGKTGLKKLGGLLPHIVSGDFIKGSIEDLGVDVVAKA